MPVPDSLAAEDYCYLLTTGRVTGKQRTTEIWFAIDGDTLYMLSGGRERSDRVKNARKTPAVKVRIGRRTFAGTARLPRGPEDARARRLVAGKYRARGHRDLDEWERDALVVAVDLQIGR
ncbi:MAG TPA: nitroreductase/quinone reductase family protein [Dehalococcoidia bacterium]|nr:nitroreductase/quinone reductase family protein [Dehalococcoidia bacterium]